MSVKAHEFQEKSPREAKTSQLEGVLMNVLSQKKKKKKKRKVAN